MPQPATKLGVFDSGLGGLLITRAIEEHMPDLDILYYGDTRHLPYGNRSDDTIFEYSKRAIDFMFAQGCSLIVMACNTASAACLRRLQQDYLPKRWPDRNVIGVVVPMLETAIESGSTRLGLIGTSYTIGSGVFEEELTKINSDISLSALATPLLVPLIEHNGMKWAEAILRDYLAQMNGDKLEALILACTHYARLTPILRTILPEETKILSQDEIIPLKLETYLENHPEYHVQRTGQRQYYVSDLTENYIQSAHDIYGAPISIQEISYGS